MSIGVIGAGAFGTALAVTLASTQTVMLWARDDHHVVQMRKYRRNDRRLPGITFPENMCISANLETVLSANIVLFAIPMQSLAGFVEMCDLRGVTAVACCKGIDIETGQGPTSLLAGAENTAVLTGPSFAIDIASGLPTALTLACADDECGKRLQDVLSTPTLRIYRNTDVTGAELGGALKNVIAIACGAVIGAGFGDSARAALLARGFSEMRRVSSALGAQPHTPMGLSGLGDLTLTCTSDKSRNFALGLALGAGTDFDVKTTVEGASTARALRQIVRQHNLDLPICMAVADLVDGTEDIRGAMARLMTRPLKEE